MIMANKVVLSRPSYTIYEHSDLGQFRRFASDFGLEEIQTIEGNIFFKGYGKDPYVYIARQASPSNDAKFIGGAFCARTKEDFEAASQIEGARSVDISSWPGGGKMVVLNDPNGFEMRVVWGQQEQVLPEHGVSVLSGRPAMNGALDHDKYRKGLFGHQLARETPAS